MIALSVEIDGLSALSDQLFALMGEFLDFRSVTESVQEVVEKSQRDRFGTFEHHRSRYSPAYRKRKAGLPVGVWTGKLKNAFWGSDALTSVVLPFNGVAGAQYMWHIKLNHFKEQYPKKFNKWLQDGGDELVGLEDEDVNEIMYTVREMFGQKIDRLI